MKNIIKTKKKEKRKLPIFGVGPVYVLTCLVMTISALVFDFYGFLMIGEILRAKIAMIVLGVIFIIIGIVLWIKSVIFQKIVSEIKEGHLVTDGVYCIVRNPIYSAFTLVFTGVLLLASNLFLLILPFIFWAYLTILMKYTEEKWLQEKFGDEYIKYCKQVNRVIPWFRKK